NDKYCRGGELNRGRDGTVWALDPTRPYKPLDVREGGVVASLNASGRLLAVSQGHPVHGAVNLTSAPAFNESCRLDPESVRRYRRGLATRGAASFGLQVGGVSGRSAGQVYPAAPG